MSKAPSSQATEALEPTALERGRHVLRAQQQAFQQAIVLQRDELAPPWRVPAHRPSLLRVYQFAYTARLCGALRDNFAMLPQVMGDEAFEALALAYVQAHPSRHPSIRWYGHRLVEFMAEQGDGLVPHPALVDLARMEWALRTAFDAADAEPLQPAALAEVPADAWSRLVLVPHPGVQAVDMAWAVEPLWLALKEAEASPPVDDPEWPEPQAQPHTLVAWRVGLDTRWRAVDAVDAARLSVLQQDGRFAELCELTARQAGEAEAAGAAVATLQSWLADGWLCAWRLDGPGDGS
jgi:hypothetical protein